MAENADRLAAVVVEPLIQAAAGMLTHPPGYLRRVREACDRHDVLLIVDEVATGFGRTGRMLACEPEGVEPDLMTLGKGLTGGYLPLSAVLTSGEVFDAFLGAPDSGRTFYHGHTYTGNPLAAAVALANLDLFEEEDVIGGLPPRSRSSPSAARAGRAAPGGRRRPPAGDDGRHRAGRRPRHPRALRARRGRSATGSARGRSTTGW